MQKSLYQQSPTPQNTVATTPAFTIHSIQVIASPYNCKIGIVEIDAIKIKQLQIENLDHLAERTFKKGSKLEH